jgi:membrane associated rhomboid family serine protease
MSNIPPNPLNRKNLSRATAVAMVLSTLGIILFLVLWAVLGNAGVDSFARLIISMCVPPALMAGAVGAYFLLRPGDKSGSR